MIKEREKLLRIVGAFVLLAAIVGGVLWRRSKPLERTEPLTKVRFAGVPAIVEAPSHIAYHNGYFAEEGLDLSMEINPDGKTSLEHLFEGQVDIAAVMGTPVVYSSFEREDFYIIGKMDHAKIHWAIGRRSGGITSAGGIQGKRVAVMLGTSGHFFLDSWLIEYGLTPSDIHLVDMNAPDAVEAIKEGRVDAMFYWFPFPKIAEQALGDQAIELPSENLVPGSWVIVAKKEYVHRNPETVEQFLRAIVKAENFIRQEPETAVSIHAEVSGVDKALISTVFDGMRFNLSMDQALLLDLEDQARWLMRYGYTDRASVPNYLDSLYPKALKAVKPEAVTVISGGSDDN